MRNDLLAHLLERHGTAMSGSPQHEPPASPAPLPWWRTNAARVGAVVAVPLVGLVNDRLGAVVLLFALVLLWYPSSWPKPVRFVASVAALGLFNAVVPDQPAKDPQPAAGSARTTPAPTASLFALPSPSAPEATMPTLPDFTGKSLDLAFPKSVRRGFTVDYHDASDQKRAVTHRSLWKVCFQRTGGTPEEPTVDFAAVDRDEPCPPADGEAVPWPVMPDVVGTAWPAAVAEVVAAGVPEDLLRADTAYRNDTLPVEGEYDDWRVCVQDPAGGDPVTDDVYLVKLFLSSPGNGCPEPDRGSDARLSDRDDDGDPDYLDPYPDQHDRTRLFPDGRPGDSSGSGGSSGGSDGDGWSVCRHTRWC
ncbi:hypothetical protein [Streptomyces sp. NPDC093094]|uniref:hypothetical protein n=1 Tax=Streptomyces sp. NPDC093094 TaxID=3366026 RepID=UPI003822AE47